MGRKGFDAGAGKHRLIAADAGLAPLRGDQRGQGADRAAAGESDTQTSSRIGCPSSAEGLLPSTATSAGKGAGQVRSTSKKARGLPPCVTRKRCAVSGLSGRHCASSPVAGAGVGKPVAWGATAAAGDGNAELTAAAQAAGFRGAQAAAWLDARGQRGDAGAAAAVVGRQVTQLRRRRAVDRPRSLPAAGHPPPGPGEAVLAEAWAPSRAWHTGSWGVLAQAARRVLPWAAGLGWR